MELCVYHKECQGEGKHQCPYCKHWYCDACYELFLPIDPRFWAQSASMCPQCHYNVYTRAYDEQDYGLVRE